MQKNPKYVYGPENVDVPVKLNFSDLLINKLRKHDKTEIAAINAATHDTITYHQIYQDSVSIAVSLIRMGVKKGDVVAMCSENRFEFISVMVGVMYAGAVFSPINIGYSKGELKHVMSITKPKYLFCSPQIYKTHQTLFTSLDHVQKVFVLGPENLGSASSWKVLCGENTADVEAVEVKGQSDTLLVLYSSGTTGLPKGVMLTHLNVISMCLSYKPVLWRDESALVITITPWSHAMGIMGTLTSLCTGKKMVFLPKFNIKLYLEAIERYQIVQLTVVPSVLLALCKTDIKNDVSSVRVIYSGAAPLHKELFDQARRRFPNLEGILQGYGMTECTLTVTRDTPDISMAKPGGVGYATAGNIIKVVDIETRKPLGPNEAGEICVKGANLMKGYIGKDHREDFDEEGFYRTGDIGYYDTDKYFFVVDRLKELIKYNGFQVPPAEIEAVLIQHEGIRDAGVVGIEDKVGGEVPLAFVVLQSETKLTEQEIKDFVAQKLSNPKRLRGGVRFINEIPRNPSGKILRRELRKMAKETKSKL